MSFSKEELGVAYTDNAKIIVTETEESIIQEDIEEVPNADQITPMEIQLKEEKPIVEFSEPITKKRVQLVTLSSPKNKKMYKQVTP